MRDITGLQEKNEKEEGILRRAEAGDLSGIMCVMTEAKKRAKPGWFVSDDCEYVRRHLEEDGLIIVAEGRQGEIAGFMMVDFPGTSERNLGTYLDLEGEELNRVAHMDSVAVLPDYRGNHLHERMLTMAEDILDRMPQYKYRMCTVHPENVYSLRNFQRRGYQIRATVYKYNGLPRHIMYKLSEGGLSRRQ